MIRLLLITAISAFAAFFVFRLINRRQSGDGAPARQPRLSVFLLIGLICAGVIVFVLPRFGLTGGILLQKILGFLPLIRAFLPF